MLTQRTTKECITPVLGERRRIKSATSLAMVYGCVFALHLSPIGQRCVWGLGTVMFAHALRIIFTRLRPRAPLDHSHCPPISLLVAAKNEESVIGRLVEQLGKLEYDPNLLEVWVVDDASTDRTPEILATLQQQYGLLKVLRRLPNSTGGKSGALNQVLAMTKGEIIGVFDADAQVPPDCLSTIVSLFADEQIGAVQLRKRIANEGTNFWTAGQASEMSMDIWFQEKRVALGGTGELRGNGQFVRRSALVECGGWNEHTITDDLDLTFRLHLNQWNIACLLDPAVEEEGVTNLKQLWHQRNRWAEGGYQRYLDYLPFLGGNRLPLGKTIDLWLFFITQYVIPTASVPDALASMVLGQRPLIFPLVAFSLMLSFFAMILGIRRSYQASWMAALGKTIVGMVYLLHWIPIMISVTLRMSLRQKRLRWVKTAHFGTGGQGDSLGENALNDEGAANLQSN